MDESIDAQIRAIEEYADKNDIKIVNKFIDRAKSATSDKRPAFQEMIKYCEADNTGISMVIVHKLDRFSNTLTTLIPFTFSFCLYIAESYLSLENLSNL